MKVDIRNHSGMTGIEQIAEDLYKFAVERLGFDKPCRIVFEAQGDRANGIFSPTAHYKPHTQTVTVYVDHRHPKDILRSMAHELIHHAQYCAGQFDQGIDTSPGYALRDKHMQAMEKDAYMRGNILLFREFEDTYKKGRNVMEEGKLKNPKKADLNKDGKLSSYEKKRGAAIEKAMDKEDMEEVKHDCANHVKENATGREGFPINHTLMEDGSVSHYTVEFKDEIVENIPVEDLTILAQEAHHHSAKRNDKKHNEGLPRRAYMREQQEEVEQPLDEWYQETLFNTLMDKFIKK